MLTIADVEFESRLFTGTGKFSNSQVMSLPVKCWELIGLSSKSTRILST